MSDNLKSDVIAGAYSAMRISGITVNPSDSDNEIALETLEDLASELEGLSIGIDYFFEDEPDLSTPHNVPRKFWRSLKSVLAGNLCADFGKDITPPLQKRISAGYSFLYAGSATPRETQYPTRAPIGAGNSLRYNRFRRFYQPVSQGPNTPETIRMVVGDIGDFVEHFDSYLVSGEDVSSYTIVADDGIVVVSDSSSTTDVSYQIRADGVTSDSLGNLFQVKIVMTTTDGRIETRLVNFELTTIRDIP